MSLLADSVCTTVTPAALHVPGHVSTIRARHIHPEKQQLTNVLLSSIFFMADSVVKGNLMI